MPFDVQILRIKVASAAIQRERRIELLPLHIEIAQGCCDGRRFEILIPQLLQHCPRRLLLPLTKVEARQGQMKLRVAGFLFYPFSQDLLAASRLVAEAAEIRQVFVGLNKIRIELNPFPEVALRLRVAAKPGLHHRQVQAGRGVLRRQFSQLGERSHCTVAVSKTRERGAH